MKSLGSGGQMLKEVARYLAVIVAGLALWKVANIVQGTTEPWDSVYFFGFYGGALALSAAFGFLFPERAWRWGVIILFALFPVMKIDSPPAIGADMSGAGLFILAILSAPAAGAAAAGSLVRRPEGSA